MRIFLIALLTSLIMSSSVRADPLKDLSWVGPQILSAINDGDGSVYQLLHNDTLYRNIEN